MSSTNLLYTMRGSQGDDPSSLTNTSYNHMVVAISYFSDSAFTTPATPSAGTIAVEGRVNGNRGWSPLAESPVDCTDDSAYVSTSIPIQEIRTVATGLDEGVFYQVTITANRH